MKRLLLFFITLFNVYTVTCTISENSETAALSALGGKNDKKTTIFIHGSVLPVISRFVHEGEQPLGLHHASECVAQRFKKIAQEISTASSKEFPYDDFYIYSWSGALSFQERKNAAKKLFDHISAIEGSVTIIAHSHGCNVALNLAEIARTEKNGFSIDKLILLAAPVQSATQEYVADTVFKKVYSFYSSADMVQIVDPQGIYQEAQKISLDKPLPFFSRRIFPPASQLKQARILFNKQSPGHQSFILPRFLRQLGHLLTMLDYKDIQEAIVNIPSFSKPHFINKNDVARYIPRTGVKRIRFAQASAVA